VDLQDGTHVATLHLADGTQAMAKVAFKGPQTFVEFYLDDVLVGWDPPDFIAAQLPDGTALTFVGNVLISAGTHGTEEGGKKHFARFQPHFVLVGRSSLPAESRLAAINVHVDDAASIFYDFDAFGTDLRAGEHIEEILASNSKIAERPIVSGDRPIIAYFSGRRTIVETTTALGRVSAHHRISHSLGGPRGVELRSRIYVELRPEEPTGLDGLVDAFMSVLRFLEILAGRPQNILGLDVEVQSKSERPAHLEAYWTMAPRRSGEAGGLMPADLPINGGISATAFAEVLSAWLARDDSRRDARVRYATAAAKQNFYDIDRLVGAANMFDILPEDAVPADVALSDEQMTARSKAREIFKALPSSPERDSVLGALGRMGHSSLKHKVRYRATIVTNAAAERFPELQLVVDEAVNCRNHYVHGSETKIDYSGSGRELISFLTNALEFVFGASELIEAGWDIRVWLSLGTTMTHPWGSFCVGYKEHLEALKALRPAIAPT
jgi:hypothetical protein